MIAASVVCAMLQGCASGNEIADSSQQTETTVSSSAAEETTTTKELEPTQETTSTTAAQNAEEGFVFQPKVCSVFMEEVFGETMCATWFNLVDAVMAGEDTFGCPDQDTYDWVMGQFPKYCFPMMNEVIEYSYEPVTSGTAHLTYLVSREEAAARIAEFGELVEGILNKTLKKDYSDFEKAIALYNYFWMTYEYDYEKEQRMYGEIVDTSAADFLRTGIGICSEIAPAYSYLLMQAGVEATTVLGPAHEWSYVRVNGHNYHIDPTWAIGNAGAMSYFMMTDEQRAVNGFSKDEYVYTSHYSKDHPHPEYTADDETFSALWDSTFAEMFPDKDTLSCFRQGIGFQTEFFEFDYTGY